ncbi:hypothetical protein [Egicoccus halophilus]|uniref:Uncharacterized protein n=1 Tax=Egicoccus halophilus TaxID=1670830 RepID=A0A8J3AD67_9ACTN|nr:hypothetical protein [Egicoccus halophilus]GGI09291.1 hypothetical protein GCM10011354_33350 [Egicoccus halophilus]
MDPMLLLVAVVVVVVVAIAALVSGRRRRDASLEPVALGPSWRPPEHEREGERPDTAYPEVDVEEQAAFIAERTDAPRPVIDEVVNAWNEYLSVIGLAQLPATHDYRIYDPYNPPVARRGPDGEPVADPERVARDVGMRTTILERDAATVLEAELAYLEQADLLR